MKITNLALSAILFFSMNAFAQELSRKDSVSFGRISSYYRQLKDSIEHITYYIPELDTLVDFSKNGEVLSVNADMERLVGMPPADEIIFTHNHDMTLDDILKKLHFLGEGRRDILRELGEEKVKQLLMVNFPSPETLNDFGDWRLVERFQDQTHDTHAYSVKRHLILFESWSGNPEIIEYGLRPEYAKKIADAKKEYLFYASQYAKIINTDNQLQKEDVKKKRDKASSVHYNLIKDILFDYEQFFLDYRKITLGPFSISKGEEPDIKKFIEIVDTSKIIYMKYWGRPILH